MVIVGIDEVGRGCWAGPLVAGAVVLKRKIPGLKDSKLLTKFQREKLATKIEQQAVAYGLGWVSPDRIDELGLTEATRLAMAEALGQIKCAYDKIIIDGNYNYLSGLCLCKAQPCNKAEPCKRVCAIVGGDNIVASISAASILAKVARDNFMHEQSKIFPVYEFDKHVGYGTKLHHEMLKLHGICELHRKSYAPVRAVMEAAV